MSDEKRITEEDLKPLKALEHCLETLNDISELLEQAIKRVNDWKAKSAAD